jgi:uncharacterized protein
MTRLDAQYMTQHQKKKENNYGANNNNHDDSPVTVIVTRKSKKGKIKDFEEWMDGIIHEAIRFEGHMGVNIIRPLDLSNPEYVIIFRFNTYENLRKWENSQIRKEWLKKSKEVTEGEPKTEIQTGLEFWFTPRSAHSSKSEANSDDIQPATVPPPPRYKMAIVTAGIVFVMLNTLLPEVRQLTATLPLLLSTLTGVVIMVFLMTYLIMPLITRALKPWLNKKELF